MSSAGTRLETPAADSRRTPRWRVAAARILVVLTTLLAALSLVAGYVRYQALDTATVQDAASNMIANDAIRAEVAATLVDQLYTNVDVGAALKQELPADQQRLAAPLAGVFRELSERAATRLLARPRVQEAWVRSVTVAHRQLLRLLDDRATAIQQTNGVVVLNLRPLVIQVGDRIAIVGNLAQRLPPDAGQIEIMKADQLRQAQRLTHALDILGRFLWLVTLLLAALAVWVAPGRRRKTLRSLAIGGIVAGLLVLIVRRVAGDHVVDALAPSGTTTHEAVADAWDILTALLVDGGRTLVAIGVVLLIGTWLGGETRSAGATRRELAPLLARWEIAYGSAAALMLLLVWWGPTVQFHRWQFVVVFGALLALGVWAVRRLTLHEHPGAHDVPASTPFAHLWNALRGGHDEHPREQTPPPAA